MVWSNAVVVPPLLDRGSGTSFSTSLDLTKTFSLLQFSISILQIFRYPHMCHR